MEARVSERVSGSQEKRPSQINAAVTRLGEYAVEAGDLSERLASAYSTVAYREPTPENDAKDQQNRAGSDLSQNLNDIADRYQRTIGLLRDLLEDCDL